MKLLLLLILCLSFCKKTQKKMRTQKTDKASAKTEKASIKSKDAPEPQMDTLGPNLQNNLNNRSTKQTIDGLPMLGLILPNESNDGKHSFKQIHLIFKYRSLGYMEIKSIFNQMDLNKDNYIQDSEWIEFHQIILGPYQKCVKNPDYTLHPEDILACIQESDTIEQIDKLLYFLCNKVITLDSYIWLRRVNRVYQECGDNIKLQAQKMYCGLRITSPRTKKMTAFDEKQVFQTAVILGDGYNFGQQQSLEILDFIQIAYIHNILVDYEMFDYDGNISYQSVIRATQEDMMNLYFIPLYAKLIFDQVYNQKLSFAAWAGYIYSIRIFKSETSSEFMNFEQFEQIIEKNRLPPRLSTFLSNTTIPDQNLYEIASQRLHKNKTEKEYFQNYANILFLEKKNKLKFKKNDQFVQPQSDYQNQIKYSSDINNEHIYKEPLPEYRNGADIVFKQFDRYQNGSIWIEDWLKFVRMSFTYFHYDTMGLQMMSYRQLFATDTYFNSPQNVFPLKQNEQQEFISLFDYLTSNMDYILNFKQFLAYFLVTEICKEIINPMFRTTGSLMRGQQCIYTLGFRISNYNSIHNLLSFDTQINEQSIDFLSAFNTALEEDIVACRIIKNDNKIMIQKSLSFEENTLKEPSRRRR